MSPLHLVEPQACVSHDDSSCRSERTKVPKREYFVECWMMSWQELPRVKLRMKGMSFFVGADLQLWIIPEVWKIQKESNNLKCRSAQPSTTIYFLWLRKAPEIVAIIPQWGSNARAVKECWDISVLEMVPIIVLAKLLDPGENQTDVRSLAATAV